jgi:hypothetical protein
MEVRVNKEAMIAHVAIKKFRGGGAMFAYLPNTNIKLPAGWQWSIVDGEIDTEDVYHVAHSFGCPPLDLDETCRIMCTDTGVSW